jgi:cholesterol transport system auxiliary component
VKSVRAISARVPRRAGGLATPLLAALLAGCTSLLAGPPSAIFDLSAPSLNSAPPAHQRNIQVLVPEPSTVGALDTERIAGRPTPSEYAYLPGAVWSDRLPKLLQTRLVETLQNSGRARAVAVPGQGLLIDYQVVLDVRAFELTTQGAHVDFSVRVMDDRNGRVVRSRVFQYLVPVQGRGTAAVVAALDRGMEQAFTDIANWAFG